MAGAQILEALENGLAIAQQIGQFSNQGGISSGIFGGVGQNYGSGEVEVGIGGSRIGIGKTVDTDKILVVFNGHRAVGAGTESTNDITKSWGNNGVNVLVENIGMTFHHTGGEFDADTDFDLFGSVA